MRIANILLANIFVLGIMAVYLSVKLSNHTSHPFSARFNNSVDPRRTGSYLFLRSPTSITSATLVVLSLGLIPLAFTSLSYTLGRDSVKTGSALLRAYYLAQIVVFFFFARDLYAGRTVDWVTGILDQQLILIGKESRYWIFNLLVSCGVALYSFENILRNATKKQADGLKCLLAAFAGFIVYFAYLSAQILLFSYISDSMLLVSASIISVGVILLSYAFAKHPFWQVEIRVSRRIIFGCLSTAAVAI